MTELRGVGPERAKALERLGIETVLDLLTHYPRRYLDRTKQRSIAELAVGEEAMVLAQVRRVQKRTTRNRKTLVTVDISDGTGHLRCTFFQGWWANRLKEGTEAVFYGKLDTFRGQRQMTSPIVDVLGDQTGRIVPVYPQSDKERVYSRDVGSWMTEVLERAGEFAEPLPDDVRAAHRLVDRTRAFLQIHHPDAMADLEEARRRLVFDELLRLQLALVLRKRALEASATGIAHDTTGTLVARFHERLGFALTDAQHRTITEIAADLAAPRPMHRLLQGDVGSGKTIVAVSALLVAVQGGHQGALMAPTEVLAEQHQLGVRALLDGFTVPAGGDSLFADRPLQVALLTNRTGTVERRRLATELADGRVDLVVGTHALIQEQVAFRSLGVVVIDEQHRFGVEQRAALRDKGTGEATPDVLVMTATPIPRTAAMTVYGDLDVSVLDELPPGRTPIETHWARTEDAEASPQVGTAATLPETLVWQRVRDEVAAGRQAYVVCPLIEGSDKVEVASAEETYEALSGGELAGMRLGLLHGRVRPAEKEQVMERFRSGALDVIVATTVIEVGVDVPNATVMVILDADRFGIAQLHQLRGRVGRGADRSWCYLLGAGATPEAEARLTALVASTDGFALAEIDLDLRGEGTILGERQKGRNDLKLASLRRDRTWVERAREVAFALVDADPGLSAHPLLADEVALFLDDEEAAFLLKG
ncbi:ATP-dependent DNA helicase RecG [soil metagenome]